MEPNDQTPSDSPTEAKNEDKTSPKHASGHPLKPPPAITVNAPSPEAMWQEIVIAFNYLTRLNIKLKGEPKQRFIRKSMAWFPLIGALIGLFGASVDWVMTQIGLPGIVTSTFAVISMLWITRALHEEEFASLANQYGKNFDKEQKVGWLKEERSVQYGTLAVILVIFMKIGAIGSLSDNDAVFQALIAAGCWSRTLMVVMASWLRPIKGDPVADYFQQPHALRMIIAVAIGILVTFAALDDFATYALVVGGIAGMFVALIGATHLRGYNGPLMGTLQAVVEITILGVVLVLQ